MSFQSLVSWVKRQPRLVELKDEPLSRQCTSRSAFPCVLTPAGQGVLNLLCGILQRPLFWSLGTKNGLQLLPPTFDIQSASVHAKSKFPREYTVQLTNPADSSMYAACQSGTCTQYMSNLLKKASPKKWKLHVLGKPLRMATRQSTLHLVDIPVPKGIHHIEQIWHSIIAIGQEYCQTEEQCPTLGTNCHKGVVFQTIKSFVHALGILSSNDRGNYQVKFSLSLFGNSDLQKMVIQFTP